MKLFFLPAFAVTLFLAVPLRAAPQQHKGATLPSPRLAPGLHMRYQLSFRSVTHKTTESVVRNPLPSSTTELTLGLGILLAIDDAPPPAASVAASLRLRATYEQVSARVRSDDPAVVEKDAGQQYKKLEGKSFLCVLPPAGSWTCGGDGNSSAGDPDAEWISAWLVQSFAAARFPSAGISLGQNWGGAAEPENEIPLAGLRWVRQFAYLADEPCDPSPADHASPESCAVIRVRSLLASGKQTKDQTPDSFRDLGLRTRGSASGTSESRLRISFATGLLVSSVGSASQKSDVTVSTTKGDRRIRTVTEFTSEFAGILLPEKDFPREKAPARDSSPR